MVSAPPANAVELASANNVEANLDVTLTYGITSRMAKRDSSLSGVNSNDGNENYDRGISSSTASITAELDVDADEFGLFLRTNAFYDYENQDRDRSRTPLSTAAKNNVGKDAKILDAYAYADFEVNDNFLSVRIGNQVLNWGESTFIQNGINVINPFDVGRLRTPGSELREALVPVPMISASMDFTDSVSVEGFYQTGWQKTEIDPVGSYFSTNDYVAAGGRYAFLTVPGLNAKDTGRTFGPLAAAINSVVGLTPASGYSVQVHDPAFLAVGRASDREAKDTNQWGVALRYFSEELNNTEFGLYFIRNHSRLPVVSGSTSSLADYGRITQMLGRFQSPAAVAALQGLGISLADIRGLAAATSIDRFAKASNYFIEYPEDINTVGLSFNTALADSGWALQGEYSHHSDVPLQREELSLFTEALRPLSCLLQGNAPATCARFNSVLGKGSSQGYLQGYVRRDVSQAQLTATRIFGSALGSDSTGFIAEIGATHVHNMPDKKITPLDSGGAGDSLADATSYGYRGAVWLDYNNAIGAVKLRPYLQFQHDFDGTSPAPYTNFVDGRKVFTLGLSANYLERWNGDISITKHSGSTNPLSDRDFLQMSISYSF